MKKHFLQLQAYTTKNKAHEEIQNYVRQWHNAIVDDESLKNMLNDIEEEISRINAKHARCKDIYLSINSYTENSIQYSVFENFYLTAHKVNREVLSKEVCKHHYTDYDGTSEHAICKSCGERVKVNGWKEPGK